MSLQFGVNIPVQWCARHAHAIVLTIEQANRSVSLLGFDNQAASATCQAAWLRNTSQADSLKMTIFAPEYTFLGFWPQNIFH